MKEVTAQRFFHIMYVFMAVMCCLALFTMLMSIIGLLAHKPVGLFGIMVPAPYEGIVPVFNGVMSLYSYHLAQKYKKQTEALKWR